MGNGSSASNKNGALKETLGDHEERLVVLNYSFFVKLISRKNRQKQKKTGGFFLKTYFI